MNWMELCHPRDGSGVVYAVGKPIKPQEKTRVSWTESSAGRRARASLERTRNENLDSCAEIKSDMGISGELYGYAVMIEARYASRWGSQLCTAVSSFDHIISKITTGIFTKFIVHRTLRFKELRGFQRIIFV